jgi:Uma2 family endonuclease
MLTYSSLPGDASCPMPKPLRNDEPMSFEDFAEFLEDRPDRERWELIDGIAVMNPTPLKRHQRVVTNLLFALERARRERAATWSALPSLGVRIPGPLGRAVIPDVLVVPPGDEGSSWTFAPIVACEILSPSTRRTDLAWKPAGYRDVPTLQHFVLIDPAQIWLRFYDRAAGWKPRTLTVALESLPFTAIGVTVPLADIYQDIGFGEPDTV